MNEAEMHKQDVERVKREQRERFIEIVMSGNTPTLEDSLAEAWLAGFEAGKKQER